jgi:resolvase-like protein
MIVGYARVSTDGQTLDAQQAGLKAAGAERIFSEKISDILDVSLKLELNSNRLPIAGQIPPRRTATILWG